jgi:IclR family acetate operon transcriptional repressor
VFNPQVTGPQGKFMTEKQTAVVQSLDRGLIALEKAVNGGVKISELAAILSVDRSTAYRLLHTLVLKGYLEQDEMSHRYMASPSKLFLLANKVAESRNWLSITLEYLKQLRDRTRHSASLAMVEDGQTTIIAREFAIGTPTVLQELGSRYPVHSSATGKAIVAFFPEAEITRLLDQTDLPAWTTRSKTDPTAVRLDLDQVASQGYAVDDEETFNGVHCIAAPIYNHQKRVLGSIGISGPVSHMTMQQFVDSTAKVLLEVSRNCSAALGDSGTTTVMPPAKAHVPMNGQKR